jgi:sec-independent protein translocase protein TatA
MFGLGVEELIVILIILLLLFGAKKLPELARSIGQGAREMKKGFQEETPASDDSSKKDKES